jgi:hypothetical protein
MALAWMTVRASVTLAALLTVILLPLVLVTAWKSRRLHPGSEIQGWAFAFAAMTLAMLGMTWRGEAWKWAALDLEARASRLPPQCLQLLPNIASYRRDGSSYHVGAQPALTQLPPSDVPSIRRTLWSRSPIQQRPPVLGERQNGELLIVQELGLYRPLDRSSLSSQRHWLLLMSPATIKSDEREYENHNDRHPNTIVFYMTYIV